MWIKKNSKCIESILAFLVKLYPFAANFLKFSTLNEGYQNVSRVKYLQMSIAVLTTTIPQRISLDDAVLRPVYHFIGIRFP